MERLSRAEWANTVERMYGLVAWLQGERVSMRVMRCVLLSWPMYCAGVVLHAAEGKGQ